ncbi:MAG: hypothetical protein R2770_19240 [Acidimicrobiales bacterium]|nr:hypothetical protein [Acidimicrobiales bacterium]
MELKPGSRLFSAVCTTEMIVVKAPGGDVDITIGGAAPVASAAERDGSGAVADGHGGGTAMGKRYVNADDSIEILCTKAGDGVAAIAGEPMELKEAKALPSSD